MRTGQEASGSEGSRGTPPDWGWQVQPRQVPEPIPSKSAHMPWEARPPQCWEPGVPPNRCTHSLQRRAPQATGPSAHAGLPLRPGSPEPTLITHPCPPLPWPLPMGSESQGHERLRGASPRGGLCARAGSGEQPQHFAQRTAPGPQVPGASTRLARSLTAPPQCPLRAPPLSPDPLIAVASRAGRPQISALIKMMAASVEGPAGCLRRKGPSCPLNLTARSASWDPASSVPTLSSKRVCHAVQQGLNAGPKMRLRAKALRRFATALNTYHSFAATSHPCWSIH